MALFGTCISAESLALSPPHTAPCIVVNSLSALPMKMILFTIPEHEEQIFVSPPWEERPPVPHMQRTSSPLANPWTRAPAIELLTSRYEIVRFFNFFKKIARITSAAL